MVACDMPFINPDIIRLMLNRSEEIELVIPSLSDGLQPLNGPDRVSHPDPLNLDDR